MKLTSLLKEIQEEQKNEFEFETDAQGNLEVWTSDHEKLLAVVDKESGRGYFHRSGVHLSKSTRERIEAAAERFLVDESNASDPTAMYADRMGPSKKKPGSNIPDLSNEAITIKKRKTTGKSVGMLSRAEAEKILSSYSEKNGPIDGNPRAIVMATEAIDAMMELSNMMYEKGYWDGRDWNKIGSSRP